MLAKDLMQREVLTVQEDDLVENLVDTLIGEHIHGAPVLNGEGRLVGVVSQQDVFFSAMTRGDSAAQSTPQPMKVKAIMTSPAVSVTEETDVESVCRVMHKLRIHRVPVVRGGRVTGIITSLDICGAISKGENLRT